MAFIPDFSSSESLSVLSNVTFTDTSTNTPGGLTGRKIFIRLANGNYLTTSGESTTPASEDWAIGDSSITLDLLTQSTAADVTVEWLTNSTITGTKTIEMLWDLYDYMFGFELIQSQTATPNIISDTNYYGSFFQFITNIWCAESAITYGSDIYSSQAALNVNQNLINNQNLYF